MRPSCQCRLHVQQPYNLTIKPYLLLQENFFRSFKCCISDKQDHSFGAGDACSENISVLQMVGQEKAFEM